MSTLARPEDWEDPVSIPQVVAPAKVLVPIDGSHNSERALAWGELVAKAAGSEMIVMVVYEQPLTMRGRGAAYIETIREELHDEAVHLATEAVELLIARGVNARGVVIKGEPARGILDVADDEAAELIVMGRHGLTAELRGVASALDRFRDLLQGGITEKVTGHATIQVLVVA